MCNFNDEFWRLDSSCLTFLTQTALFICGATLEIIHKTHFYKRTGAEVVLCMQIVSVCVQNVHSTRTAMRFTHFIIYCSLMSSHSEEVVQTQVNPVLHATNLILFD